mgnify:CR=1 FL=1
MSSTLSVGLQLRSLAGVAAPAKGVLRGLTHCSIPRRELERIAGRYGWWAARKAEAFCPEDDVACVEREARRLLEVA